MSGRYQGRSWWRVHGGFSAFATGLLTGRLANRAPDVAEKLMTEELRGKVERKRKVGESSEVWLIAMVAVMGPHLEEHSGYRIPGEA
ncbi:hypothetical protein SKAU_G00282680 [Synaphobranchus kaupii]|uniref:Uncharacterized protein n=1 Tax=Synaphobranchus kaupii TaxID=118154 RepID=A0A9Q1IM00_SYNKA|nr:hypothetical protein SKAU_G00282680 [Synaphobranchus kaupii]